LESFLNGIERCPFLIYVCLDRFPMDAFHHEIKRQMQLFMVNMKRQRLVEMARWEDGQWEFPHDMKREIHFFMWY
jgi:hypothetical protein